MLEGYFLLISIMTILMIVAAYAAFNLGYDTRSEELERSATIDEDRKDGKEDEA